MPVPTRGKHRQALCPVCDPGPCGGRGCVLTPLSVPWGGSWTERPHCGERRPCPHLTDDRAVAGKGHLGLLGGEPPGGQQSWSRQGASSSPAQAAPTHHPRPVLRPGPSPASWTPPILSLESEAAVLPAPVAPPFPALILQAHAAPGAPWSPRGCPEAQGLTGGAPPLVLVQGDLQLGQVAAACLSIRC